MLDLGVVGEVAGAFYAVVIALVGFDEDDFGVVPVEFDFDVMRVLVAVEEVFELRDAFWHAEADGFADHEAEGFDVTGGEQVEERFDDGLFDIECGEVHVFDGFAFEDVEDEGVGVEGLLCDDAVLVAGFWQREEFFDV